MKLIETHRNGKGMNLVVSQLEAVMSLMREGVHTADKDGMLHGVFETADEKHVAVSVPAHGDVADLVARCRERPADRLIADVEAIGGHAATVINVIDTAQAPIFQDLEVRIGTEHPITGREDAIAAPWRINNRRAPVRKPAPLMAEGNTYVLRDILGLSDDVISSLKEQQVV